MHEREEKEGGGRDGGKGGPEREREQEGGCQLLHPGCFSSHMSLFGTGSFRDIETIEMTS